LMMEKKDEKASFARSWFGTGSRNLLRGPIF
jgi:hypothetical protein